MPIPEFIGIEEHLRNGGSVRVIVINGPYIAAILDNPNRTERCRGLADTVPDALAAAHNAYLTKRDLVDGVESGKEVPRDLLSDAVWSGHELQAGRTGDGWVGMRLIGTKYASAGPTFQRAYTEMEMRLN